MTQDDKTEPGKEQAEAGKAEERRPPQPRKRQSGWKIFAKWAKRLVVLLFFAAVVGMIVLASLPKPVPVELAKVAQGPLEVTVDEDGRTRVKDRYTLSSPLNGNLARIELHAGDTVKQDAVLARIVPLSSPLLDERSRSTAEARLAAAMASRKQQRAQITRAQAALEYSEKEAERLQKLSDEGAIPAQELERALLDKRTREAELTSTKFGAKVADYELQMAQAALGYLTGGEDQKKDQLNVPCPVNGQVLKVIQRNEGAVQAGTPLLEVGDPAALEIVVDVLTSDAVSIRPGSQVRIERWGGETLAGVVRLVEPSAFTRISSLGVEEQRVNAVIDLRTEREKWKSLGDGYRVEARIIIWQKDGVLKVPASAVFRQDDGWAVYAVREGFARLQTVKIGKSNGIEVQIVEGLQEGDDVVTHPSDRVTDGVEVTTH